MDRVWPLEELLILNFKQFFHYNILTSNLLNECNNVKCDDFYFIKAKSNSGNVCAHLLHRV